MEELDNVNFFFEEIEEIDVQETKTILWLNNIADLHKKEIIGLNYIFCDDEYLLEINREHLDHDYYTDIITFDQSEEENELEGDIYISLDRVRDNAKEHNATEEEELRRVISHGILHLIGFKDKTEKDAALMRKKEDECIKLFFQA